MQDRPFFSKSIAELEAQFEERQGEASFLRALLDELARRTTQRAAKLRERAATALASVEQPARNSDRASIPPSEHAPQTHQPNAPVKPLASESLGQSAIDAPRVLPDSKQ